MARRKKFVSKPLDDLVSEYKYDNQMYALGQSVYCRRHVDGKISLGQIDRIYPESPKPYFSFIDEATGQHRFAYFRDIISDPTRKNIDSVNSDIAKNSRVDKDTKK